VHAGGRRAARERLVGHAPLAGLVAAALCGLGALHLESATEELPDRARARDGVAAAYLRLSVERQPRSSPARLDVARKQLAIGRHADAELTLAPLLDPASPASSAAVLLALDAALAAWRAAAPESDARTRAEARAIERLGVLARLDATPPALAHQAAVARELGRPDLAARLGKRAARLDGGACAAWLSAAARDFLASGDAASAGATYARGSECSRDAPDARALGVEALDAYLSGDQGAEALRLAERLVDRFPSDRELLERAEAIALAQDDPARARRFGGRLASAGLADAPALRRLLDLDLAAGDLQGAARVAGRLTSLAPEDPGSRRVAASAATWAGHPRLALHHWMWLARRGDAGAAGEALRLARSLPDDEAVVELLALRSRGEPLPPAPLAELAAALLRLGPPQRAIAALEEHAARFPASRAGWEALAALQERERDLAGAIATRAEIARRFGASLESSLHAARLHRTRGRPGDALAELRAWSDSADLRAADYWTALAELAWDGGERALAERAYRALWRDGRIDVVGAERLFLLARAAGRRDDAIRYGRDGWSRLREPRLLLLAMDEAHRAGRWGELARLAGEAERAPGAFAGLGTYWMLRARLDERYGRIPEAAEKYRRALEVDPRSAAARSGLLWLLAAGHRREELSRWLASLAEDARDDPGLWRAYAAGLEELGRRGEALAFHERLARAAPDDAQAQERYRAALESLQRGRDRPTGRFAAELGVESLGPVTLRRMDGAAGVPLAGGELEVRAGRTDLTSSDPALRLDSTDVLVRAALPALGGRTELSGGVQLREDGNLARAALAHARRLGPSVEARAEASWNERADESAALLVKGVRTRAGGALAVAAGRFYGRGAADWKSWSTRAGTALGEGGAGTLEVGVVARAADPEVRLRLQGGYQRNRSPAAVPELAAFVPGVPIVPRELGVLGIGAAAARWRVGPARVVTDAWLGWISPPARPAYRVQAGLAFTPSRRTELSVTAFTANDRWDAGGGQLGVAAALTRRFPR
jgi:tetratricopeptide (TPR) repeat protein